jgi:hypothetical protein
MRWAGIARRNEHSFKVAAGPQAQNPAATSQQTPHICCNEENSQVGALGTDGQRAAGLTSLPDSTPSYLKRRVSGDWPRIVGVQSYRTAAATVVCDGR